MMLKIMLDYVNSRKPNNIYARIGHNYIQLTSKFNEPIGYLIASRIYFEEPRRLDHEDTILNLSDPTSLSKLDVLFSNIDFILKHAKGHTRYSDSDGTMHISQFVIRKPLDSFVLTERDATVLADTETRRDEDGSYENHDV